MKFNVAYKFRIYPNSEQEVALNRTFGCCRFLWNRMLDERNTVYDRLKDDREALRAHAYRTERQYKQVFPFLAEVDSKALQSSTSDLLTAFRNFFRGLEDDRRVGYPRFKSRRSGQSYTTYNINGNTKVDFGRRRIKLPKIRTWIRYRDDRTFEEPIRHATVSKTKSGRYFVSIITERELDVPPLDEVHEDRIVAFDMSASHFLVSEGARRENPRFYRKEENKLRRLHRMVSRKQKGSKNRDEARVKLARRHDTIHDRKTHWTHQVANELLDTCDAVILEDLNIKGMQQFNSGLSKSITLDFSWGQFKDTLKYKAEWMGKCVKLVDRFYPSSKLCSTCGWKYEDLTLSERKWTCKNCGTTHERDENASANLKSEGIRILEENNITILHQSTVGTTGSHAFGDRVGPLGGAAVDELGIHRL